MGRYLTAAGLLLLVVGAFVLLGEKLGVRLGSLPGDIRLEGKRGGFYFPITTCIVISAVLSFLSWLFRSR